jgi:hypothetical protein
MKKRSGPDDVEPVTLGNIRYEAPPWGKERGLGQNGGHVVAVDQTTGAELWVAQLYELRYDPNMEADKQDTFISRLSAAPDGGLSVETERGTIYLVDLSTLKVTPVPAGAR